jgi:hypothetical protein
MKLSETPFSRCSHRVSHSSPFRRRSRVALFGGIALTCAAGAKTQTPLPKAPEAAKPLLLQPPPYTFGPVLRPAPGVLPLVRVTLSRPVYFIAVDSHSGAPQMPHDVTATAEVLNWPPELPRPKTFQWHVALDWNYPKYPTHHDISRLTFEQPGPFTADFGRQIRGGTLVITAKTSCNGHDVMGRATASVRGVNPSCSAILNAFPRTRFGLIASKVAMHESSMRQFTEARGTDPGGMPEMSRTNDLGIMQLNAPTGSVTSADQIWDWRENVRRGMDELAGKQRTAVLASRHATSADRLPEQTATSMSLLNFCREFIGLPRLPMPRVPSLSAAPGSGITPDDLDVDHLALSQLERDAIRRYNGGREYSFRVLPDPTRPDIGFAGWQIDPSRGGIYFRSGDPDYVRHVLRAHSGLTLPPPPKPSKPKKHDSKKASHRRSRHMHKQSKPN